LVSIALQTTKKRTKATHFYLCPKFQQMIGWLRGFFRIIYFLLATLHRIGALLLHHLFYPNDAFGLMRQRTRFVRHLYKVMGFELHRFGELPTGNGIVMGNHRSYFDPALVAYDLQGWPVAKAEVEKWPIIGFGAKLTGVVFVKRESRQSRADTLDSIKEKIEQGWLVFLFPEGTTKGERLTTEFRLGGFNLAAKNSYTIWPVAIEYEQPDNYWINNETFIPHLFRQLSRRNMKMYIWYGPPMTGTDGEELMLRCRAWIDAQLEQFQKEKALKAGI
jgi:lyso-ornithine lipid O-acyltransferase